MNASLRTSGLRRVGTPLVGLALFLAVTPALSAQDPLGVPTPPAPERECVCAWGGEAPPALRSFFRANRARLGVELGETAQADGRTGIRLRSVQEGGPAARAGIRSGDILLSLNGTQLGDDPARRLMELLEDVEPEDTVTIGYSREGRNLTARAVTDRANAFSFWTPGEGTVAVRVPRIERLREGIMSPDMRVRVHGLFGEGLELVEMNEGLGQYFDASEGVLVTSVGDDSALGLRAGDVILAIGGREVRDPGHARAILASYRPDETITFEIVRERRRTTVTGTRAG